MIRDASAALALPGLTPRARVGRILAESVAAVEAKLAVMRRRMDADDIETTEDGCELDAVVRKGGNRFYIELDREIAEIGRRAEYRDPIWNDDSRGFVRASKKSGPLRIAANPATRIAGTESESA